MASRDFSIGLFGFGTIGTGLVRTLQNNAGLIRRNVGFDVVLKKIVDVDTTRDRGVQLAPGVLTSNAEDILDDPEITVVVELIGGTGIAREIVTKALKSGKHVVSANKDLISRHGPELVALARRNGVSLLYEASVGGGIPILTPLATILKGNRIQRILGIVNGTTNYILSTMKEKNLDFETCLRDAQALGYAEANPTNDIEGLDAAYKATILASVAFGARVEVENIHREGISAITKSDMDLAEKMGYTIKLLAIAEHDEKTVDVRVHPALLPHAHPLAGIHGVLNGIFLEGSPIGPLLFVGRGAGPDATSSAVLGDILEIAEGRAQAPRYQRELFEPAPLRPIDALRCAFYLRMIVDDRPGVLADITRIFGDRGVSIASNFQKALDRKTAEIVWVTHNCVEKDIRAAIADIRALPSVREIPAILRILGEENGNGA